MVSLRIAMRFLRSSRGQTILIVLGIAIGVSVQVFVGTLLQSLQASLVEQTIGNAPHITVLSSGDERVMDDWEAYVEELGAVDGVEHLSGAADSNALFNTPGNDTFPGLLRGLQLEAADGIYDISDRVYAGGLPAGPEQVMVGRENQEEFSLEEGDSLNVVLANGTMRGVTISGFFDLESAALNRGWVIASLETSQDIFGFGGGVTSVEMQVDEPFTADSKAGDVEKALAGEDVEVRNWKDDNQQLLSALQAQGSSSYMIQFFVLASVMISIGSILAITVVQKSRQIGILKAMGITNGQASSVFLIQGLFYGLTGGILGVVLGLILFFGFTGATGAIEPQVNPAFIIASALLAAIVAAIAAVSPARRSARLDPVEVIRNG